MFRGSKIKFSIEVSSNKRNSKTNPWYGKNCKIARRAIKEVVDESLKIGKIKIYKTLTKREKRQYIRKRQENLLHLSKIAPKKFWRQIITRETKDNNKIALHDWNSYLKKLYESPYVMDNFETLFTTKEVFSLKDIDFGVNRLANGISKDIEGYQAEILKIGGPVLIPHIHKLFNQVVKQGFPKPSTQSFIIPIFKSLDTNNPSNYQTIMISPLLAKLYGIILERKLSIWLESEGKQAKGQACFRKQHSTTDHLVMLKIIVEECRNDKSNLLCCFVDFRKVFNTVPTNNLWNRLEELKVPFELRVVAIRLYENAVAKLKSNEGWSKDIKCNIRVK